MNIELSDAEKAFRAEVRQWLESMAPKYDLGRGDNKAQDVAGRLALGREFQARKAEQGYAKITWPRSRGGMDGTAMQAVIYDQEEALFNFPTGYFAISLGMPIPVMARFATEAQQQRHIGPALRGDEIWCQMFSEPAAGSDLGGIRLRAKQDGDSWVLNGQKIWTSWAHISDFGVVVTRSNSDVPKHRGMTYFFIDMKSPGIEVRPIVQAAGGGEFCEVFFDDVRVPDTQRLGNVGEGWKVAIATLMEERFAVLGSDGGGPSIDAVIAQLAGQGPESGLWQSNSAISEKLVDWYCTEQGLDNFYLRQLSRLSQGDLPGPEAALSKLLIASKLQSQSAAVLDYCGPAGAIYPEDSDRTRATDFRMAWLEAAGYRIAGGTDEILLNTIAERVLGLPGDMRTDRDVPFSAL